MRTNRSEEIQLWIDERKNLNEISKCIFYITMPQILYTDVYGDTRYDAIKSMLERNNVKFGFCDTVLGSWNLNQDWLETNVMDCIVEYCGVYPINWNIDDLVEFERMVHDGEIIVSVIRIENEKYIPNY